MQNIPPKMSLLGLVLMAASAVASTLLPTAKDTKEYIPGSLTQSTRNGSEMPGLTCTTDTADEAMIETPCNITRDSGTTGQYACPTTDMNNNSTAGGPGVDL